MKNNIDIKNLKTAKRYASALCSGSIENIDEISENMALVDEVIFKNPDFVNFFSHPIVSLKDKKDTINETFDGKINENTLNFLNILLDEGRFNIFKTIYSVFQDEADKIKNKQKVFVVSASDLTDEQKTKLASKLSQKLKADAFLCYEKDDKIIGGLVIKYEDKVIDLSLKTKFDEIRKSI